MYMYLGLTLSVASDLRVPRHRMGLEVKNWDILVFVMESFIFEEYKNLTCV